MNWQHIYSGKIDWHTAPSGVQSRTLMDAPLLIREFIVPCGTSFEFNGLALVSEGNATLSGEHVAPGALAWCDSHSTFYPADDALRFYGLELPPSLAPDEQTLVINANEREWQDFEDPAGRPTQPVQVLLDGPLSALRTRFEPTYEAGEHWHDFDTLYFITRGDMQFGNEGQYYAGDIRHVKGGFSYGPEKPGPQGVEFVLLSLGGSVSLHWADLVPAPNGTLP